MRALRFACTTPSPPPPPTALSLPSLCQSRRWWSLTALLSSPTPMDLFLKSVRQAAASSSVWDLDFSAITERGAAAGCRSAASQSQLMYRVGAALSHVLSSQQQQHTNASSPRSSAPGPSVQTLRLTLPTPEAIATTVQLVQSTSLLSAVTSVELIVESSAVSVAQDCMKGTGGCEAAELLRVLAQQGSQQLTWVDFSLLYREAASPSSTSSGHGASSTGASLLPQYAGRRNLWDDATVAALAKLMNAKPWRKAAMAHVDLTRCSPRTRQALWAAYARSHASLTELSLNGVQPARELISMGLLRRFSKLNSVDVGQTQLEGDAVVRLLRDLHEGGNGWWHLRHLCFSQCEFSDAVVEVMAEQLREQQAHQQSPTIENSFDKVCPANSTAGERTSAREDATLASLDLSGTRLSRTAVFALAGCLVSCANLKTLNTRHCRLQADDVEHLAAALQNATGLRTWALCRNRVGDRGVVALAKYGKYWPNLQELDLTHCRLTSAGLDSLSAAIPAWGNLEVLRLVGNDLRCLPRATNGSADRVAQGAGSVGNAESDGDSTGLFAYDPAFMKGHGSSAKVPTSYELDRRDRAEGRRRYRGTEEFDEAAAVAAQGQAARPPLERLGESLALCLRLRLLDLSDCSLADEGLRQLTLHLTGGWALEELRLAANPLFTSVGGLDVLVELLGRAPQLNSLDLSFTGLGDLGLAMLCDGTSVAEGGALTSMTKLATLQLSSCAVHALGWESLTAALPCWPALRHVSLNRNVVSEVGLLRCFLQQLAVTAPVLQSVCLMGCVADQRVARQLLDAEECRVLLERGVQLHL